MWASSSSPLLETQVSYFIQPGISLILDAGYTTASTEWKEERQQRIPNNNYSVAEEYTDNINLLAISIGIKYYITELLDQNTSAYVQAGAGKQFAFVKSEYSIIRTPENFPDLYVDEQNYMEFAEDLNSPYQLFLGFGAEYFINKSLSINASVKFIYSAISGTFDGRRTYIQDPNVQYTAKHEFSRSEFTKRVGLGLNFYF